MSELGPIPESRSHPLLPGGQQPHPDRVRILRGLAKEMGTGRRVCHRRLGGGRGERTVEGGSDHRRGQGGCQAFQAGFPADRLVHHLREDRARCHGVGIVLIGMAVQGIGQRIAGEFVKGRTILAG